MPTYQITRKGHYRATYREDHVLDRHGNAFMVRHAGDPQWLEPDTLVDDLTPEEIRAFPDRFQLVSGDPLVLSSAAPRALHPALFTLLHRGYTGDATADEQTLLAELVPFMADYTAGKATSESIAAMRRALEEFDLALFT